MSHAPTASLKQRHQNIRRACQAQSLDALIVTSLPNVLYLSNFKGSAAIAVLTADRLEFITDFRYLTALDATRGSPSECPDLAVVPVDTSYEEALAGVLQRLPGARVGFEAANMTVARMQWLERRLAGAAGRPGLVATERLVERARVVKDAFEIAVLRESASRLSEVAVAVTAEVRRGRTEKDIAQSLDRRMLAAGFERPAFDTIVASGPNAALPHARPGERTISEGDLVVLDFGGVYDSYCSDLTRTVSVGPASARAREVHQAVRDAHDRAIAAVRPGRSRFAIDAAARDLLGERGLGEAFGHGTGHGLGIEIHEDPRIGRPRPDPETDEAVAPGMVFTIEPGAYLPGWGGVRIEDDVLVTAGGVEVLTAVTTDLVEI